MALGGWPEADGLVEADVLELSDRLDAVRSLEIMRSPARWPWRWYLPVKREIPAHDGPGSLFDCGRLLLLGDVLPVVFPLSAVDRQEPIRYETFEELVNDGWRVD